MANPNLGLHRRMSPAATPRSVAGSSNLEQRRASGIRPKAERSGFSSCPLRNCGPGAALALSGTKRGRQMRDALAAHETLAQNVSFNAPCITRAGTLPKPWIIPS